MPCSRCASPLEDGDLRCAVCALPVTTFAMREPGPRILRCGRCSAAVGYDASVQAPRCTFCGESMFVEEPVDPIETAQLRVPFLVEQAQAEIALHNWLASRGWFAPRTLADEATLHALAPIAWAAWIVDARAEVTWTADSNRGAEKSVWAPHAGRAELEFADLLVPASRGLTKKEASRLVYDLDAAIASSGDDVAIERFDAQRSAARATVMTAIEAAAKTRIEAYIPGNRYRNVKVACLLEAYETRRVALPAYVMAYRYRERTYRAIVHGQRTGIVVGRAPLDWWKVGSVIAVGAAIVAVVIFLSACGDDARRLPIDAPSFVQQCVPDQPTFAPLTGRMAVQAALDVHVEAGGLIHVDTTSSLLVGLDLVQTGTGLAVTAEICSIQIPDVPLAGQDKPIHFDIAASTIASVGKVPATGVLGSADATCTTLQSDPITVVLGARVDPGAALPVSADDGTFPTCGGTTCADANDSNCACDQEGDGKPGATLSATNVPIVAIDQAYVALRTTFSLAGQVFSSDAFNGVVTASLDTSVLACRLQDGSPCIGADLRSVRSLAPVVTQQPDSPSTFRAVRVDPSMTCEQIVAGRALLFPR